MHIQIIQIGKTKHDFFVSAEQEYLKRLQTYAKIKVITLKEASNFDNKELTKKKEAEGIIKNIPEKSIIIVLDQHGKEFTSEEFALYIEKKRDFEGGNITFIIGGAFGLDSSILEKFPNKISFSKLTFTHEQIRTLLLEQLYRAFCILSGKTYHF